MEREKAIPSVCDFYINLRLQRGCFFQEFRLVSLLGNLESTNSDCENSLNELYLALCECIPFHQSPLFSMSFLRTQVKQFITNNLYVMFYFPRISLRKLRR